MSKNLPKVTVVENALHHGRDRSIDVVGAILMWLNVGLLLAMLTAVIGCHRSVTTGTGDGRARRTLQTIETCKALPALLASELSATSSGAARSNATFLIGNETDAEVPVTLESKTCTCLDIFDDQRAIEVGERFSLPANARAVIRLVGRLNAAPGVHRFGASFASGDKDALFLEASQIVYADIECAPSLLAVKMPGKGDMFIDQSVTIVQTSRSRFPKSAPPVTRDTSSGIVVTSVSALGAAIELERGLWRREWRADLRLTPTGIANSHALVRFTSGRFQAGVTVVVTKARGISSPEQIAFGSAKVGEKRKRRVVIYSVDDVPFEVTRASVNSQELRASTTKAGNATRYWLDIEFCPCKAGERRSCLLLETTHPFSPSLAIETVGLGQVYE